MSLLENDRIDTNNFKKQFMIGTTNWEIVYAKTYYTSTLFAELTNNFAQIYLKFKTPEIKETKHIVFERNYSNNNSRYYWKIFVVDYYDII